MKSLRIHLAIFSSLFLGLMLFFFLTTVSAQEGINNLETSADYSFGQELRFSLGFQNATNIEIITLVVRPKLAENIYKITVPFEPGEEISLTHSVPVNMVNLKPFTQVNYHWELNDGQNIQSTNEEILEYEDDRFVWQQMTQGATTVHWTGSGPFFGQDVLTVANEALEKLTLLLPIDGIIPYDIYVYPSSADLRAALRLAGIGDSSTSQPELGVILVTAVNPQTAITDLGQSLPYELAQLLLYSVSVNNYDSIPWWLREGIGLSVQTQTNPRFEQLIDEAVRSDQTIPLRELCVRTERVGDRVLLASAQSNSIVEYILRRYGEQAISDLVATYQEGDDCDVGIKRIIGLSIEELESDWLNSQQDQSVISQFLSSYGIWIFLFLAGTILMFMIISMTRFKSV